MQSLANFNPEVFDPKNDPPIMSEPECILSCIMAVNDRSSEGRQVPRERPNWDGCEVSEKASLKRGEI